MRNKYFAWVLALATLGGVIGPIGVALANHKLHLPVDQFLPGASALFLPPTLFAATSFVALSFRYRHLEGVGVTAMAFVLSVLGMIAGLIASILFLCAIAGQCL